MCTFINSWKVMAYNLFQTLVQHQRHYIWCDKEKLQFSSFMMLTPHENDTTRKSTFIAEPKKNPYSILCNLWTEREKHIFLNLGSVLRLWKLKKLIWDYTGWVKYISKSPGCVIDYTGHFYLGELGLNLFQRLKPKDFSDLGYEILLTSSICDVI